MRIALVSADISPLAAGVGSFIKGLADNLCSAGQEVTLLTSDIAYRGELASSQLELDPRVDIKLFKSRSRFNRRIYRASTLRKWLEQNVSQFDIVHIQGVWSFITVDAANVCARSGVPYIITTHGHTAREDWKKRLFSKPVFFKLFCERGWKQAGAIHFLSEGERENSVVQATGRSTIVPNAVAAPPGAHDPRSALQFRRKFAIAENVPIILFLGRIVAHKGVAEILDAFQILHARGLKAVLVLAGTGNDSFAEMIAAKAKALSCAESIRVTGPLYGEDKAGAFASATVFATLSLSEGLPIAPLEAIASGVPIVISERTHIPEVAEYRAGLIVKRTANDAADALAQIVADPQLASEMAANALKLARECFSWQAVLPKMINFYQAVAEAAVAEAA
jgi:glycosyltransferase involved in cell wall biosynthesis